MRRWRGLLQLVQDAVEHGSIAIEKVQLQSADRAFGLLEQLGPIARPVKVIHGVYELSVMTSHRAIRLVNQVAGGATELALSASERESRAREHRAAQSDVGHSRSSTRST